MSTIIKPCKYRLRMVSPFGRTRSGTLKLLETVAEALSSALVSKWSVMRVDSCENVCICGCILSILHDYCFNALWHVCNVHLLSFLHACWWRAFQSGGLIHAPLKIDLFQKASRAIADIFFCVNCKLRLHQIWGFFTFTRVWLWFVWVRKPDQYHIKLLFVLEVWQPAACGSKVALPTSFRTWPAPNVCVF